jgi:cyclophilin family peptidyl-prolyl cis-trans isomerase
MPTEKRQRQDEGRISRLEAERAAAKRRQRAKGGRNLAIILVLLLGAAFLVSVLSGDDGDETVTSDSTVTTAAGDTGTTTAAVAAGPAIGESECPPEEGTAERVETFASGPKACIDPAKVYTATIETSKGTFVVELDAAAAPKTVNNFVFLARNHYYDGVVFHRIIPGFVVQGGDPTGSGSGGPGYQFADELPTGEAPFYEIGSLAMANSGANTNGSQFFIVTGDQGVNLPASYSRFGKVLDGLEVVQAIEATGTSDGAPSEETKIVSISITEE